MICMMIIPTRHHNDADANAEPLPMLTRMMMTMMMMTMMVMMIPIYRLPVIK